VLLGPLTADVHGRACSRPGWGVPANAPIWHASTHSRLADGVTAALGRDQGGRRHVPVACGWDGDAADPRGVHQHPKPARCGSMQYISVHDAL